MNVSLQRYGFPALGFQCDVQLYASSRIEAKKLVKHLAGEMLRLEQKYSGSRRDSLVTEINYSAGNKTGVKLDQETHDLLAMAESYYQRSEGRFDITAGLLRRLWNFRQLRIPEPAEVEKLKARVGFDQLQWRGSRLLLPVGMEIDFANLLPAYAVDKAAQLAQDLGIRQGLVNLGGHFVVIGPQPEEQPWPIGIADPKQPDKLLGKLELAQGGLATRGDYAGTFEHEGVRYNHMLNPLTGWPGSGLRAVSLAAESCSEAVFLATVALLQDAAQATRDLEDLPHGHMRVEADGTLAGSVLEPASA